MHTHTHSHSLTHTHTHIHTYAHSPTHTYIHTLNQTHIHTDAHMHTHTHVLTHTHSHFHSQYHYHTDLKASRAERGDFFGYLREPPGLSPQVCYQDPPTGQNPEQKRRREERTLIRPTRSVSESLFFSRPSCRAFPGWGCMCSHSPTSNARIEP